MLRLLLLNYMGDAAALPIAGKPRPANRIFRGSQRCWVMSWSYVAPILLLLCSNIFMTFAWYGQLKFPGTALSIVVPVSWGIAFLEYCFAVPANRIGYTVYSAAQLKTMQEIITVAVFAVFSVTYLNEAIRWNHLAAFGCLVMAAFFAFHQWR